MSSPPSSRKSLNFVDGADLLQSPSLEQREGIRKAEEAWAKCLDEKATAEVVHAELAGLARDFTARTKAQAEALQEALNTAIRTIRLGPDTGWASQGAGAAIHAEAERAKARYEARVVPAQTELQKLSAESLARTKAILDRALKLEADLVRKREWSGRRAQDDLAHARARLGTTGRDKDRTPAHRYTGGVEHGWRIVIREGSPAVGLLLPLRYRRKGWRGALEMHTSANGWVGTADRHWREALETRRSGIGWWRGYLRRPTPAGAVEQVDGYWREEGDPYQGLPVMSDEMTRLAYEATTLPGWPDVATLRAKRVSLYNIVSPQDPQGIVGVPYLLDRCSTEGLLGLFGGPPSEHGAVLALARANRQMLLTEVACRVALDRGYWSRA